MFRFLKSLFRRTPPAAAVSSPVGAATSPATVAPSAPTDSSIPIQRVETAQLSLAAIMSRFPDELRKLVLKLPPPEAMVILPLPTIQKMLPTGSVKMSLASIVRQAPPGTFSTINPQDKRMVEVPLAEIFKRINPALLKKRSGQKLTELAAEGFDIFGDAENPHALAPKVEGSAAAPVEAPPPAAGQPARVLKVPPGVVTAPPPSVPVPVAAEAKPAPAPPPVGPVERPKPRKLLTPPGDGPMVIARKVPPPAPAPAPKPARVQPAAAEAAPQEDRPPLVISLGDLIANWPEPIKSEAAALNGAMVSLPCPDISAGLAKGKVSFTWGQLRGWINPPLAKASEGADATELILPLRVLAPAFLKHTKGGATARKAGEVGDIPELFAGGKTARPAAPPPDEPATPEAKATEVPATPAPAAPEPAARAEPVPAAEVAPVAEPAKAEEPVVADAGAVAEKPAITEPPAVEPEAPAVQEPAAESPAAVEARAEPAAPAQAEAATAPAVAAPPATLSELFGEPDKASWSPTEVVNRLCALDGVAGAVVALQEGLVIAHKLPEPLKGEIFAAFLPQIFARLNQYAGEMKLGGVEELSIQTDGGPCHIFRRGQVFFAALTQPDSSPPMASLRLCADAVAS